MERYCLRTTEALPFLLIACVSSVPNYPHFNTPSTPSTADQHPSTHHQQVINSLLVALFDDVGECLDLGVDVALLVHQGLDLLVCVHDCCVVASSELLADQRE